MPTEGEIKYHILNTLRGGSVSDDEAISDREVIYMFNYARGLEIQKILNSTYYINDEWIQDLGCIPLTTVDKAECCDIAWGCKVLRSVDKIPAALSSKDKDLYTFLGLIDKVTSIPLMPKAQAVNRKYSKYTSTQRVGYIYNNYLYILHDDELEFVNLQGVFGDPREAGRFSDCDGSSCYTDKSDYPIDQATLSMVYQRIFRSDEFKIMGFAPTDQYNNARNDVTPINKA